VQTVLPTRLSLVTVAAAVAALVSVPVTALAFVGLFAVGGQAPVSLGAVVTAMLGWHVLIGVGEALITGVVVSSVIAARPDLVYGARRALSTQRLEIRGGEVVA
jgi:cobalt/nickel transport system permease protein